MGVFCKGREMDEWPFFVLGLNIADVAMDFFSLWAGITERLCLLDLSGCLSEGMLAI
jgi:hypothetical protein